MRMCCVFTTNAPHHCCFWLAAAASLLAVVSPQFCMPQQTVLVMQEQAGYKSDDFTITDATGTFQRCVGTRQHAYAQQQWRKQVL
jgi:hypothetical protein